MRAYKAFNAELQATMGRGIFQFEPGGKYIEKECKCAHNGFHCAENPLCVLEYYNSPDTRFFIVEAGGDINQDGTGSRISCTELTLVKEIGRIQLATLACLYIQRYPGRKDESRYVIRDKGRCMQRDNFIIVRGEKPMAAGVKGSYLFLLRETETKEIGEIFPVFVDGEEYRENVWYGIGREGNICEKKN